MFGPIFRNEWRALAADRTLGAVTVLLAAVLLFGAYNGARWSALQAERQQGLLAEERERIANTRAELLDIAAGGEPASRFRDPRDPSRVGQSFAASYALLPPAPLAPLAVGQSDLLPAHYKVTLGSSEAILAGDELENPTNLLAGGFDVAFVIVFLYPLVILALSYNLLSGEKESGTLALTLSQPVSLGRLAAAKILVRAAVAFGLTAVFTLVGALAAGVELGAPGAATDLGAFFGVTAVYGLFWFALALLVNSRGLASPTNAMILSGAWLTLTLVIPSGIGLLASTRYPVPSRVEMIQAVREATQETSSQGAQLLGAYYADHPEMAPEGEIDTADYASRRLMIDAEVERRVSSLTVRFEERIAGQQGVVENFKYLSPAVLVQEALNDLAGTSFARFAGFQDQVESFAAAWKDHFTPQILRRAVFTPDALDALPRFAYEAPRGAEIARQSGGAALAVLLAAAALFGWSFSALRRYRVVG